MRDLRDWKIGDSVRNNAHHQQAVDALRELQGMLGASFATKTSRRTEFVGKIVEHGKDDEDADIADFTDSRYWVQIQFIEGDAPDAALSLQNDTSMKVPSSDEDTGPFPPNIVPATNLAEYFNDTHLLPVDGSIEVRVAGFYDEGAANSIRYAFCRPLDSAVVVRIDANATGGGKYNGKLLKPASDAEDDANDLAMPEGMTVGDDCLILHLPEDGLPTHWIKLNTTATGVVIGRTDEETPKWIVAIPNGTYRTASPNALSGSGATDPKSWDRNAVTAGDAYGDCPITVEWERTAWDGTAGELKRYVRVATFDAGGNLVSVTDEAEAVIDEATDCDGE